jgi:hypothetical protein
MPWSVYSAEDFPKRDEDLNEWVDYKAALGCTIVMKAHEWTPLEDFYKHTRWESWMADEGNARETVVTGKQVAERMYGDFKLRGIRAADLDRISPEEKKRLEDDSEATNMKFRRMFIDRFEQQFRVKTQGGPGRWVPNTYEAECYKLHNMQPPDVVQRIQQPATAPQVIIQEPDPEMIARLVAAEVAKQAQATVKTK